jgi:hypothetical protein
MGRGGYDTTEASNAQSSAGQEAINGHHQQQAEAEVWPYCIPPGHHTRN